MSVGSPLDDLHHPLLQGVHRVLSCDGIQQYGQCIVDDESNIQQAILAGCRVRQVFTYAGHEDRYPQLMNKLKERRIPVFSIRPRTCKKLFAVEKMTRLFALVDVPATPDKIDAFAVKGELIVCDGLMMMGNIGAILRSAVAFGQKHVLFLNRDPHTLYDRRLIRASRGYVFCLHVHCLSVEHFIQLCMQHNRQIVILDSASGISLSAWQPQQQSAVVLGAEKHGSHEQLRSAAHCAVRISMDDRAESLNVSVAAGIILQRIYQSQDQIP